MWHFLHYLPKVTDGSCIFDKRERKIWMDDDDLTPVITSCRVSFKTEGGSKSDRGYKKLHAIPKVDNDSLLRFLSSLALTTRWDKVVWNYPIPYFISYPCAIFSGTWARCQYAENQVMFWMVRKECSQLVPSYHDSIPKLSSGVPKSGSPVWREQIPDSVISVYNNK